MTPRDWVRKARAITKDKKTAYRTPDEEYLDWVNDALGAASKIVPRYFYTSGDMACQANSTRQALTFDDTQQFIRVVRVKDGGAVVQADLGMMDAAVPDWHEHQAGPARNWLQIEGDPVRFFVYPPAPNGQVLEVIYVRNPRVVTLDDVVDLPLAIEPAMVDYLVYRVEMKDDDHANSGRAASFLTTFAAQLQASRAPKQVKVEKEPVTE